MRRALAATVVVILLWSAQDAIIWRVWFEGRPWSDSADLYQFWHQAVLVGLIVLGVALLRGVWGLWFAAATWALANSGLADVLYYWLALKPIPATLPWLDKIHPLLWVHPATSESVIVASLFWVGLAVVSGLALAYLHHLMEKPVHGDIEGVVVRRGLKFHRVLTGQ